MTKETRLVDYRPHEGVARFAYRPDSYDKNLFGEFKAYTRLALAKKDVVLDVGAHIGVYTAWAASRARKVLAVEPEPTNVALLVKNMKAGKFANVEILEMAAVGANYPDRTVEFFIQGVNTVGHSMFVKRGRTSIVVPATAAVKLMKTHKVTVVKLDCEGAEYPILLDCPLPDHVRGVVMEMHFGRKVNHEQAEAVHKSMKKQGFKAVHEPNLTNMGLWHTNAMYER